jgi:hypothetical protein
LLAQRVQKARAMSRRIYSMLCLATSLAACVANDESTDEATGAGGKADGQGPVIVFDDHWRETASGTLVAGDKVRVDYDVDRLQSCRGTSGGSDQWGISGYASFDGGAPVVFGVTQLQGGHATPVIASVDIPATATSVELWFAINNRWGCIAYDSNENQNYRFAIKRSSTGAVLSFDADWNETQSDAIHAGDSIVVHYDPARLAGCQSSSGGHATWAITAFWRVDGGTTRSLRVTRETTAATIEAADPKLTVPSGSELEMWFQATNVYGCHDYDSNLNANYHFTID